MTTAKAAVSLKEGNPVEDQPTLREARKARCLSVPDVAHAVGVRDNTVYRWERGVSAPPLVDALRVARFLGTSVDKINWWPHGLLD